MRQELVKCRERTSAGSRIEIRPDERKLEPLACIARMGCCQAMNSSCGDVVCTWSHGCDELRKRNGAAVNVPDGNDSWTAGSLRHESLTLHG